MRLEVKYDIFFGNTEIKLSDYFLEISDVSQIFEQFPCVDKNALVSQLTCDTLPKFHVAYVNSSFAATSM